MSQEYNATPTKRAKSTARAQRNRPVLVTDNAAEPVAVETLPVEETPAPIAASAPKRRLPNFFSTVGKSAQEESNASKPEVDPAQARLARATRTPKGSTQNVKAASVVSKETTSEKTKEAAKPATKSTAPAKPASAFKTRHIIGIAIYLLAANFLGLFESSFLRSIHADSLLTKFNLFGNQVSVYTSTLLFLATLIIILVLLAKFDFIPRSFGAAAQPRNTGKSTASTRGTDSVKTPPATICPGVKGSDDKLYEAYRMNQRREKKR